MNRRLCCFLFIFCLAGVCLAGVTVAQNQDWGNGKFFTADLLKSTLFARTAGEQQFCDYVIQKRDDGTIPAWIIYGVYRKAISTNRNHRFTYFKAGLEIVCKQRGIILEIPAERSSQNWSAAPLQFWSSFKSWFQR